MNTDTELNSPVRMTRMNKYEHEAPENLHNESPATKGRRDSGSITEYKGTRMMTETLKKRAGGRENKDNLGQMR